MENNQQRQSTDGTNENANDSFKNQQPGQQVAKNGEEETTARFAETSGSEEQHSESSRPQAENETLGTP